MSTPAAPADEPAPGAPATPVPAPGAPSTPVPAPGGRGRARTPASTRAIPARQQRVGLAALASGFVMLALLVGGIRGIAVARTAPPPVPVPTGYVADPTIPAAAQTALYSSGQAASGQWAMSTLAIRPASRTTTINLFTVRVETSLYTDPDVVARFVQATLDDERGWASFGKNSFQLTNVDADNQLAFYLASPKTVDALCGATTTKGKWDCRVGNKIVLNSDRWFFKAPTYDSLPDYRAFMVNRQVGFWLGQATATCRKKGTPAPVMVDQSVDLGGCTPWPWPRLP